MTKPKHFYTNIDINSVVTPFLNSASMEDNISEKTLYPFVDIYADTQITDVLFDIFCQYSATDTAFWSSYADKFEQKNENGVPVDYYGRFCGIYAFNRRFGLDPYAVWFRRCREKGLHPWISIRMNDCHCPDEEAVFLRSDFFYEAYAKGWMVGDTYGYYRRAFDYSIPAVREKMTGYIAEQLDRYDADGLELDFSREMICFDYLNNPDCAAILNAFMREIKEIVKRAEARHGHSIRIGVRLMRDIAQNLVYGMDAVTWVREKLVDLIAVCPRWASCDSDMPIAVWKAAFPDVEISAGITDLVHCVPAAIPLSPAVVGGYALRYLCSGADPVYLFNFFINPKDTGPMTQVYTEINRTCGAVETILEKPYRHIVTYQDIAPMGYSPWQPLPVRVTKEPVHLEIRLGKIPEDRKTALLLGFTEGIPEDIEIAVNGQVYSRWTKCTHGEADADLPHLFAKNATLYRAQICTPEEAVLRIDMKAIQGEPAAVVSYLEAEVY